MQMTFEEIQNTLLQRDPLPPLHPRAPYRPDLSEQIHRGAFDDLVKVGLFLLNDDLEAAHDIAQREETPEHCYWHAILHRREGDDSNALYWYRRVPDHPVFRRMRESLDRSWSPQQFVRSTKGAPSDENLRVQAMEMRFLLEHCRLGKFESRSC